ncbi:MAG: RNA polymerase sigma factor [Calditrichaeota bacterium]|nr:MAG: RNA polymerase sigma factor [Calditrichota bacterium]
MSADKTTLARLLRRAQKGDQRALQTLCQELENVLRGYFVLRFRDPALVDDLCQEVYLRLLNNLLQIKEPMKLKNFVLKVAFHVMQDFLRQKYRDREELLYEDQESGRENEKEVPPQVNPGEEMEHIVNRMDLEKALSKLPLQTQKILKLKADGYKYEEIASELNMSLSAVKMQVKRGLEKLQVSLYDVTFLLFVATIYTGLKKIG